MDDSRQLRAQAKRCRQLADQISDVFAHGGLIALADDLESRAAELESENPPVRSNPTQE
ncbi:hypothetical protein SCH01S_53_00580 [Sphingomonas changbaiensis NBRC 104936]|uniref:Uncharacterized protein n=1 Tax=Sphingomonas changbaiensis NBRC 104936 TaxID=1219043 RepID=A0A0E9MU98_9SPHN|nr:hypothetical protein [Sphingomonas changbaiensis]GAO40986.1 hypothetical protein SCH01S_53_00580 [Sphingomonas changbaiensis NBRC 104936]